MAATRLPTTPSTCRLPFGRHIRTTCNIPGRILWYFLLVAFVSPAFPPSEVPVPPAPAEYTHYRRQWALSWAIDGLYAFLDSQLIPQHAHHTVHITQVDYTHRPCRRYSHPHWSQKTRLKQPPTTSIQPTFTCPRPAINIGPQPAHTVCYPTSFEHAVVHPQPNPSL